MKAPNILISRTCKIGIDATSNSVQKPILSFLFFFLFFSSVSEMDILSCSDFVCLLLSPFLLFLCLCYLLENLQCVLMSSVEEKENPRKEHHRTDRLTNKREAKLGQSFKKLQLQKLGGEGKFMLKLLDSPMQEMFFFAGICNISPKQIQHHSSSSVSK